uniref:Reverse transcriptase domain-containing protein n=1 Tax=Anolis carolinensis TaxID=28377 RepID=A0A803SRK8_ANOCA
MALMDEYDLVDSWREFNPDLKDYTYYSSRHQAWSRIDMIWCSRSILVMINNIQILARDISDHCPLTLEINRRLTIRKWRLDGNLIKQEEDIIKIKAMTKEYFKFNKTQEMKPQIVWDAYKAVARGFLIKLNAEKRKQKEAYWNKLTKDIETKEKELKANPKKSKIKISLDLLVRQRKSRELDNLAKQMRWIKQNNFENANKPGKWLARLVRKKKQSQLITKIRVQDRVILSDEQIREEFKLFYGKLYTKDPIDVEKISEYLGNQKLDKITDEQRLYLNKDITETEIIEVIRKMDNNKAPGPDGFTSGFYKLQLEEVIQSLKEIMNLALHNKIIPDSWKEATIIMIPKEGSAQADVKNFRPISLLNNDYKIFAKILANRLKDFLEGWVGEEQTGFLPGRNIKDNVRVIIDSIEYYEQNSQKEVGLLSLDAEKAFDNLNWDFFKLVIRELDMGFYFQNGIESIYNDQWAKIQINGQDTGRIAISKGTRQGCPLSPLIFIMALEILLRAIKKDDKLQGIRIDRQNYKYRAFADDLICIVDSPKQNIKNWLKKLEDFGAVAGFRLNKNKTVILTKNMSKENQEVLRTISGLETPSKIKYLGIWLSAKNNQLLNLNYITKWKEIKQDLGNWANLKISLMGRIAIIKMNVLPKLIYLFQNIPIIRQATIFKGWQKEISKFIWGKKKPRIKYSTMILPKLQGGFGLPDFKLYHEACALHWVKEWIKLEKNKILTLEGHDLRRGWHSYLWYDKTKIEKKFGNHFIRST